MMSSIWSLYAAVLAVIFVVLSVRVVKTRGGKKIAFGDGGITEVQLAVRTQQNFAEYVPFALLLLIAVEAHGWESWVIHSLGGTLIAVRLIHVYGLWSKKSLTAGRVIGAGGTWLVMIASAVLILCKM